MAEKSTFVKIDRNIMKWRWYKDGNTMRVFLHFVLNANVSDFDYGKIKVKRGQLITSRSKLSKELDISDREIRTAIDHLKQTGEITISSKSKGSIVTVVNYDSYQSYFYQKESDAGKSRDESSAVPPSTDQRPTSDRPASDQRPTSVL